MAEKLRRAAYGVGRNGRTRAVGPRHAGRPHVGRAARGLVGSPCVRCFPLGHVAHARERTRESARARTHARAVTRGCPIGHGGAIRPPGCLGQLTHSFTGRSREIDKIHKARRCTTRQAACCHDNLLVAQRVSSIEFTVHRMVRRVMRRMMRHASVPVTRGCAPRVPVSCSRHGHRPRACASGVVKPRSAPPRRPGYDSIRFPHTFAGALP